MSLMRLSLPLPKSTMPVKEGLIAAIAARLFPFRQAAHRRQVAELSDRQLRDAGIDPSLAGRGKAVAVSAAALRRLNDLSLG